MPLDKPQTVVITGASAGVGRAIALTFARRGWNVGLLAREPFGLESAADDVRKAGGDAMAISVDVSDADAIFAALEKIAGRWGTIDVWINNAMATIFGPVSDISPAEFRRVTEVTYLGYVFGTMAALKHMRSHNVGTIVQVGSALSYRAIPLQSAYCGAKFAIRGFTDALRSELQHEKSAVRITMIQLPAVNTPQFNWARNKMPRQPQPMPPIYQPDAIAEKIFGLSQRPPRESWLGFSSVKVIIGNVIMPALLDKLLARIGYDGQLTSEAQNAEHADNLFQPLHGGHATRGRFDNIARAYVVAFNPSILRAAIILPVVSLVVWAILILARLG
jgi:NAD(P)-dependent dehydrogenase (short-subunit alcohol dehydrogenase family)